MSKKIILIIVVGMLVLVGGIYLANQETRRVVVLDESGLEIEMETSVGERAFVDCQAGEWVEWGAEGMKVRYQITGIERHTILGDSVELCCGEGFATYALGEADQVRVKTCLSQGAGKEYSILWATDMEGEFFKSLEAISFEDGRVCQKMFGPDGAIVFETEDCFSL